MSPQLPPELFAAFDRVGDPLDDPHVQDWLQQNPEHLAEFAVLRAQSREVASVPMGQSWPHAAPWWRRPPFVLLGIALVVAVVIAWRTASTPPLPRPRLAPRSSVHSVVVSSSSAGKGESVVDTFARGNLADRQTSLRTFAGTSAPTLKSRSTLSIQHSVAP